MPLELALRGINAGLGFVGLLLLLNCGGLLREYALLLPVGLAISLVVDAGRAELALKHGLHEAKAAAIPRRLSVAAAAIAVCVVGAARLPLSQSGVVAVAVGMGGVAQVYVDIALRHSLYIRRSVLFVSGFQCAGAMANVLLAYAGRQRLMPPEYAAAALAATPALLALALRQQLLTGAVPEGNGAATIGDGDPPLSERRGTAIAFRVAPTAGYSVYLLALHHLAPSLEATARALYFVFGFLHIRTMARRKQSVRWTQRAVVMGMSAAAISVPIIVFDRRADGIIKPHDVLWATVMLAAFSVAGTRYLNLYEAFLKHR